MDWLKAHEYLGVWMALPLMVIVALIQSYRGDGKVVGVPRMTIYFCCIICLAAVFSPALDEGARWFAAIMFVPLLVTVIYHAYIELLNTYPKMPD